MEIFIFVREKKQERLSDVLSSRKYPFKSPLTYLN